MNLEELLEHLYDLDRYELRRLAWEALLISDGPDSPFTDTTTEPETVRVYTAHTTTPEWWRECRNFSIFGDLDSQTKLNQTANRP